MKAIVTISALLVCAAAGWQLAGQVSKDKTRPLQTKIWMKTVNGPHCSTAAAKNVDDARAALNNSVLASCKGCHSVHRAKK